MEIYQFLIILIFLRHLFTIQFENQLWSTIICEPMGFNAKNIKISVMSGGIYTHLKLERWMPCATPKAPQVKDPHLLSS